MKKPMLAMVVSLMSVTLMARTNTVKNATSDWTDPNGFVEPWVPGSGDCVIIPEGTSVSVSDDNPESLAQFCKLSRVILASETSEIDFTVNGDSEVVIPMPITSYGYIVYTDRDVLCGPIVKKGSGTLRLNSTSLVVNDANIDYYAPIVVEAGTLKLQKNLAHIQYLGCITVNSGTTLYLPEETGGANTVFLALRGEGDVTTESAVKYAIAFTGSRDVMGDNVFSGRILSGFTELQNYGNAQVLTGNSPIECGSSLWSGGTLRISTFGPRDGDAPLGHVGWSGGIWSNGGRLEYTGLGELACSRYFVFVSGNTILDGGTNGNLQAEVWGMRSGSDTCGFVLAGDGPYPNTYTQDISDGPDGVNGVYLKKEGTGTWQLSNTARAFSGGISVDEGVLQFTSYADRGTACSMGTAVNLTDGTLGPGGFGAEHQVDYAIRLGGPTTAGERKTSGRLEYVGATSIMVTNRNIAVSGAGGLRANGTAKNRYARVYGISNQAMTLYLDGDSTAENEVNDISDGTAGGKLSVVKEGTGTWYLSGNQSFGGDLAVNGGELVIRNPDKYRWYNWTITSLGPKNEGDGDTFFIDEFCLCAADGTMVTKGMTMAADRFSVNPGETTLWSTRAYDGNTADQLFTDNLYNAYFYGTLRSADGTTTDRPREDDPSSWLQVVMRLRPDDPAVTSYDYSNFAGGYAPAAGVSGYTIWGSVDGFNWEVVKRYASSPIEGGYSIWRFAGHGNSGTGIHTGGDTLEKSGPDTLPNVLGNVSAVTVSSGGKLTLEAGSAPVTISKLKLDATSGGTIEGFAFAAEGGEIEISGVPHTSETVTVPVTFSRVSGLENIGRWTFTATGFRAGSRELVVKDGHLEVRPHGMAVIIR